MRIITQCFVVLFFLLVGAGSYGQASFYNFSHQIGTFTPHQATATDVPAVLADSGVSTALPIGFSFGYCGNLYTQFFMSSNGVITLGSVSNTLTSNDFSAANANNRPIIGPLWDDLDGRAQVNNVDVSRASYQVTGTAPNRVLSVEWLNWEWNWLSTNPVISFQVKLYETTNKIEFIYKGESGAVNSGSASIGIGDPTGSGSGSFLNLNVSMTTPTVTSTASVTTINSKPADNQVFIFEPPACMYIGNLSISNITNKSATVNLSNPHTGPIEIFVGKTAPAATDTPTATIPAGVNSFNVTGLTPGTEGYKVYIRYACGTTKLGWFEKVTFNTDCDIVTASFFEGFETASYGDSSNNTFPYCWTYIDTVVNSGYGFVSSSASRSGSKGYYVYRTGTNSAATNGDILLISPETSDLGNGTKQIRFWARKSYVSDDPKFEVYSLDGNTLTANRTLIQSLVLTSTWKEYIVPLPATTDDYFAFSFDRNNDTSATVYLDDVYYEDLAPCIFPLNIKVANITSNSATVSWDASLAVGVTAYEYEIRTSGNVGSGTAGLVKSGNTSSLSVNLTNLDHSTKYYVYVRSVCGSSQGMWTLYPVDFNTLCAVYTGDFYENFDSYPYGSSTNNNFPYCWGYVDDLVTTGYGYIDNTNAQSPSNSYYMYRTNSAANANQNITLISPETDNLGNGNGLKQVRFSVKASSSTATNILAIVTANGQTGAATFTVIDTIKVDHTTYKEYAVVFPDTTDDFFGFRLLHNGGTSNSNIYIDNVYYEDAPDCKPVYAKNVTVNNVLKNTADIAWTDAFNVNVPYEVEVRSSGNPGTPGADFSITTAAGATSVKAVGLDPSTVYKVYVRAVCGTGSQGKWSDGIEITTLCDYAEFTSYVTSLPLCGPQTVKLSAVVADPAAVAAWYDKETDGVPLFEGADFISKDVVAQDRSYWLRSKIIQEGTPVKIGEGILNTATSGIFLYSVWGGYRHQYIFTADELKAAGLGAGAIDALTFDVITAGYTRKNFSLAIGTTTQSIATSTHISNTNMTQVYTSALQTFTPGMQTFTFTTPYNWDGTSNIVIQTNWSNEDAGGTAGNGVVKYHNTPVNMTTYTYADRRTAAEILATDTGSVRDSAGATSGGTTTTNARPNIIFVGTAVCESPAIEIPVTVEPKPIFELSTDRIIACKSGMSDAVTIASNQGGYDTFVWTPSTGVSGNAASGWTFSTTTEQLYTLVATQSTGICEVVKTVLVFAGTQPEANPNLAITHDVCKDVVTKLDLLKVLPTQASIGVAKTTTEPDLGMSAFVQSSVYSRQQFIYRASELTAQGVTGAGYITSLSFETTDAGASLSNPSYTLKMMLSPNTSFANTSFYTGNFSKVYTKVNHTHSFQGVHTFTFDNPFYWDGQSNIVLEILQEGAGGGNNAKTYYSGATGTNVGLYAGSATDANPLTGTLTVNRLNVEFGLEQSTVTWSPTNGLFLNAAATVPYTAGVDAPTVYTVSSTGGSQVYTATLTGANGCATTKAYTVNTVDVGTLSVQDQVFCKAVPVTDVVVTGAVTGATLSFYSSATSTTPITTISQNGTYYVEAKSGNCKSARMPFNASIVTLALPTAQLTQVICGSGTIADLSARGANGAQINWYSTATSTTPLASTHVLTDNTTYYASQSSNGCESGRIAVLVDINPAPAALAPQTISICGAINYGSVNLNQVTGAELVWYQSATSQQPIPNTSQIISGTYYVSQRVNGCESSRIQIIATAQGSVAAPSATIQNMCGGGTVAQLVAQTLPNATAEWFSSATSTVPLAGTTPLLNGTYYLAQRIGNCMSVKVPVAVRVINITAPVVSPFTLCEGSTVAELVIPAGTGITHKWYTSATSTTALLPTDVLKSGYYFVEREQGDCISNRTQVQVTISSLPGSPTGDSPQSFDNYAELKDIIMDQPNVVWYLTYDDAVNGINALPQNMPLVDGATYYAVIIGANGCPSEPTAIEVAVKLGLNDFDLSRLKYYPNPVSDMLTVHYSEVITKVEVFDLNGRLVMTRNFDKPEVQLDFSALSAGTYMLNIQTKDNSQFVKVVKK